MTSQTIVDEILSFSRQGGNTHALCPKLRTKLDELANTLMPIDIIEILLEVIWRAKMLQGDFTQIMQEKIIFHAGNTLEEALEQCVDANTHLQSFQNEKGYNFDRAWLERHKLTRLFILAKSSELDLVFAFSRTSNAANN